MEAIFQPWAWYVVGPLIALTLFLYFYFGKNFGVSTNLETICSISRAGKISDYFKKDWKQRDFALLFVLGLIVGGFISSNFLIPEQTIKLNSKTVTELSNLGFSNAGESFLPKELFNKEAYTSFKGFFLLIFGGFLVGFGSRYAGGCTSGHAITGLSSLQLPSLLATIGFFAGGLLTTWFILPLIFA